MSLSKYLIAGAGLAIGNHLYILMFKVAAGAYYLS
jgi:hypothetical protein